MLGGSSEQHTCWLIWYAESAHVCHADASSSSLSVQWHEPEQDHGSPVTGYLVECATSSGRGGPAWQKGYSGQDNSCTVSTGLSVLHSSSTCLRSGIYSPEEHPASVMQSFSFSFSTL